MAKILDGKAVAAQIRSEVAGGVAELKSSGISVRLDVILIGNDPASATSARIVAATALPSRIPATYSP